MILRIRGPRAGPRRRDQRYGQGPRRHSRMGPDQPRQSIVRNQNRRLTAAAGRTDPATEGQAALLRHAFLIYRRLVVPESNSHAAVSYEANEPLLIQARRPALLVGLVVREEVYGHQVLLLQCFDRADLSLRWRVGLGGCSHATPVTDMSIPPDRRRPDVPSANCFRPSDTSGERPSMPRRFRESRLRRLDRTSRPGRHQSGRRR